MPCGGGGVLHCILLPLSCRAAGCMRGRERGRTFVLVARAAGSCARRNVSYSCDQSSTMMRSIGMGTLDRSRRAMRYPITSPSRYTALWCFVPESDRWYLCFPPALTVELSKLDMNNGPTVSG